MTSASAAANASKKYSAGSRVPRVWPKSSCADARAWMLPSLWRLRLIILFACPSCWRPRMSIRGKWRIVRMPDYEADFPDIMDPAYILFGKSGGEFAFGCVTGAIHGTAKGDAVEFT